MSVAPPRTDVALCVCGADVGDGGPAPDVAPAEGAGQHAQPASLLHDAVVDRDARRLRVTLAHDSGGRLFVARAEGGVEHVGERGQVAARLLEHPPRRQEEHARVPKVTLRSDVLLGGRAVRLL